MTCVPNHLVGRRVGNDRIELISLLGEGSYGAVYQALLHRGGIRKPKHCAVKVIRAALDVPHFIRQRQELELHRRVSDGNGIVTLYESFREGRYQYIVMKLCPDRDLCYGIHRELYFGNDTVIKNIFTQVLDAIEYCHSHNVFHRDIKPENILLCEGGRKALLSDFGLATGNCISTETRTGSPLYMSPECWGALSGDRSYATAPNDIWSLGVLLLNLACRQKAPWKFAHQNDHFFSEFVKRPYLLRLFAPLYPDVHDILSRVFSISPAARINIKDLKAAFQRVKHFCIPTGRLTEYYNQQYAAWRVAMAPAPPRPLAHAPIEDRGQVKAGQFCYEKADKLRQRGAKNMQNTKAQAHHKPQITAISAVKPWFSKSPPPPSQPHTSFGDSGGPATPHMQAVPNKDAVETETNISDLLQVHTCNAQPAAVFTPFLTLKTTHDKPSTPSDPWQDILDVMKAW